MLAEAKHPTTISDQSTSYGFDGLFIFGHAGVDLSFLLSGFTIRLSHGYGLWLRSAFTLFRRIFSVDGIVFKTFNLQFGSGTTVAPLAFLNTRRPAELLGIGILKSYGAGLVEVYGSDQPLKWQLPQPWSAVGVSLILYGVFRRICDRLPDAGPSSRGVTDWAVGLSATSCLIYLIHLPLIGAAGEAVRHMRDLGAVSTEISFCLLTLASITAGLVIHWMSERPTMRTAPSFRNQHKRFAGLSTTSETGR